MRPKPNNANVMGSQIDLFPEATDDGVDKVSRRHLHVKKSTFLGGLSSRVHRWFRLTPSFGPDLVRHALEQMATPECSVVLDPFAGAGTTLIEARFEGHKTVGFEINPLLHFVCDTCLNWDVSPSLLRDNLVQIEASFDGQKLRWTGHDPEDTGLPIPKIHNVYRWWRKDVLLELLILKEAIRSVCKEASARRFFELTIAGVLVPDLTNVTLGRLQLHFINRDSHVIDVWRTFIAHATTMISDLEDVRRAAYPGTGCVFNVNSMSLPAALDIAPIDRVVTSPPYPNRYSYVWNTRPHLYMLDLFENAKQAAALDLTTIGGTWGTATSILLKGAVEPILPVIEREVGSLCTEIRQSDNLMANYVMKYFNQLAQQIRAQHPLLAGDAKLAYVVGCSEIKGVYIETDVLLGRIFEGMDLGYRLVNIERFRKRHSGRDLHESTVYVERT